MPSVAQMNSSTAISPMMKKRKREYSNFAEDDGDLKFGSAQFIAQHTSHIDNEAHLYEVKHGNMAATPIRTVQERTLLKPRRMKPAPSHDTKRQRIVLSSEDTRNLLSPERASHDFFSMTDSSDTLLYSQQYHTHDEVSPTTTPVDVITYAKADLSACHICHKRPRVKNDLCSYADCEGCQQRTCFICMRKCHGEIDADDVEMIFGLEASLMDADYGAGDKQIQGNLLKDLDMGSHREVVCSRCAKECGPDGHVKCNGCLGQAWGE